MGSTNSERQVDFVGLGWDGPIPFKQVVSGDGIPTTFTGPGVYIWTVRIKERHVAYYVGETGRPIRDRTIEHYKCYVHGEYRIYDPDSFAVGIKVKPPLWGNAYSFRWPNRVDDFLRKAPELFPVMSKFVGLLEMFVIPFGKPDRVRKRLEAEINRLCVSAKGDLQDDDIDYKPTRSEELTIHVTFSRPLPVAGLDGLDRIELAYREEQRELIR